MYSESKIEKGNFQHLNAVLSLTTQPNYAKKKLGFFFIYIYTNTLLPPLGIISSISWPKVSIHT